MRCLCRPNWVCFFFSAFPQFLASTSLEWRQNQFSLSWGLTAAPGFAHNRLTRLQQCRQPVSLVLLPYLAPKTAHRGKFVFTSVFPQPFPAGSNRQLLQHENVVGQKKIFSPMAFSLVSLSHIFSVGFPPRFSKYVLRSLFFVLCGSIFAWRASPLLGKTKGRDCSGFRINIHFSATFWSKFIRMLAAWAREAVLFGAIRPNHHHHR